MRFVQQMASISENYSLCHTNAIFQSRCFWKRFNSYQWRMISIPITFQANIDIDYKLNFHLRNKQCRECFEPHAHTSYYKNQHTNIFTGKINSRPVSTSYTTSEHKLQSRERASATYSSTQTLRVTGILNVCTEQQPLQMLSMITLPQICHTSLARAFQRTHGRRLCLAMETQERSSNFKHN